MTGLWFESDGPDAAGYVLRESLSGKGGALIYAISDHDDSEVYIPREAIPAVIDELRRISELPQPNEDED